MTSLRGVNLDCDVIRISGRRGRQSRGGCAPGQGGDDATAGRRAASLVMRGDTRSLQHNNICYSFTLTEHLIAHYLMRPDIRLESSPISPRVLVRHVAFLLPSRSELLMTKLREQHALCNLRHINI